jgi:hypothetical protein
MVRRVVQSVLVGQQGTEDGAQLQELVPILARPRQSAHLQPEDEADVVEAHLGEQALEAEAALGAGPAAPLVLVDDEDAVGGPTEFHSAVGEGVLPLRGLGVATNLLGGGLTHVDDGCAFQMPCLDLPRPGGDSRLINRVLGVSRAAVRGG